MVAKKTETQQPTGLPKSWEKMDELWQAMQGDTDPLATAIKGQLEAYAQAHKNKVAEQLAAEAAASAKGEQPKPLQQQQASTTGAPPGERLSGRGQHHQHQGQQQTNEGGNDDRSHRERSPRAKGP